MGWRKVISALMHSQRTDIVCIHETKSQFTVNLFTNWFIYLFLCMCVLVCECGYSWVGGWVGCRGCSEGVPPRVFLFSCFLLVSKHWLTYVVYITWELKLVLDISNPQWFTKIMSIDKITTNYDFNKLQF